MKNKKIWLIPAIVLAVFVIGALVAGWLLEVEGGSWWVLEVSLWVLGLIAAALLFFLLRARARAAGPPPVDDEVDRVFAAAIERLSATRAGGSGRLGRLPALVLMGPRGTTKTTALLHSGMETEHLAGEVRREDAVVPTPAANVWYSEGTVVVEAGGELMDSPERWALLARHLRPSRWAATFSKRAQAPRQVIVCYSCEEFLQPGASQQVPGAAQQLRARLLELGAMLGTRLPVYVVFTKADRLPYFLDYVRNFSRDEARQVLGTTLPAITLPPGSYADAQGRRLGDAFADLVHSLSVRRLEVLPREAADDVRAGAYEFPRELRKVKDLAVGFLLDLCKPSQLGVSPFLRGFYFVGVRPVFVSDVEAAPQPATPRSAEQIALGATSVFDPQGLREKMRGVASAVPSSRKLPEWVFLDRLFRDVILRDGAAKSATASGTRVNHLRRAFAAAAIVLFLVLASGFTVSYFGNRALIGDAASASQAAGSLAPVEAEAPTLDALEALDALREQAARVSGYAHEGHPWRLGWGLYAGDRLHPSLRSLYFDRFDRLLWRGVRANLLDSLHVRTGAPDAASQYGRVYNDLKAYLITTSHPEESTADFLTPVLESHWIGGRGLDSARVALADRQFRFFADELPFGNPYPDATPNDDLVASTRAFLARFADVEQLYQVLLSAASRANPAATFDGVPGVAADPVVVPGAFTSAGWASVQANLGDLNQLLSRERWVAGEHEVSPEDRARLAQALGTRYVADYIQHWQDYLHAGAVTAGGGPGAMAARLTRLSGNESPLLRMLAIASNNTAVDTTLVGPAFQPLHQVVPPEADRYIGDSNASYVAALGGLQAALDQVASSSGPTQLQALGQAQAAADQTRAEVRKLAQAFAVTGDAGVAGEEVTRLLEAPLRGLDVMLGRVPSAGVNQQGQSFCAAFGPLTSQYPFDPLSGTAASVDDVSAALMPGSSVLWSFYQNVLGNILTKQGTRYAVRPGATLEPTADFVAFFNRAALASESLYNSDGSGPEVVFSIRMQTSPQATEITVDIDGQSRTFTRTDAASKTYEWSAARVVPASISARVNGVDVTLVHAPPSAWSVFHLFQNAQWQQTSPGRYTVRWNVSGLDQPLTAEVSFASGQPVFKRDFLGGLECVPRIVQ